MLLWKLRYRQADFSSWWPRKTKAEVGIIFFLPAWGQPITEEWRAHGDGSGPSPRRTDSRGTWALCKVTTSLPVEKQGCSVLLPCLYLPKRWKSSLMLPSLDRCDNEIEAWISYFLSPMVFPWPKDTGEQECVHSHIVQRGWDPSPCLLLPAWITLFKQIPPAELGLACSQSLVEISVLWM